METYIALLRGINVSGQKLIKMADLINHLHELKFSNVRTYIQSGNILFENKKTENKLLALKIEKKILEKYGFVVPTIVLTSMELKNVFEQNPYIRNSEKELIRIYTAFLSDEPSNENLEKLSNTDFTPEEFIQHGKVLYGYSPDGFGNAKLNNNFIEKSLKVKATTRNWKTVCKLVELSL